MSSSDYKPLQGFPDVLVEARRHVNETWAVVYIGIADDLIAAGACTADMLAPSAKRGRVDADGDSFRRERYYVTRGGQARERFKLWRCKPLERLLALPGACEAIAEYERRTVEQEQSYAAYVAQCKLERPRIGRDTDRQAGEEMRRSRCVGRFQRPVEWTVQGSLICPDWAAIRAWTAIGAMRT